jgi:hypothetical protein
MSSPEQGEDRAVTMQSGTRAPVLVMAERLRVAQLKVSGAEINGGDSRN